jgi:hypothetical protein
MLTICVGPVAVTAEAALPKYPAMTREWDGSSVVDSGWRVRFAPAYKPDGSLTNRRRQAEFNPPQGNNVEIVDLGGGNQAIKITTRRHCTKTLTAPLIAGTDRAAGQNEYATKCPKGLKTRYSTGRLESTDETSIITGSLTEARLQLPRNAVAGTRFAVWMVNAKDIPGQADNAGYCTSANRRTNLSELDLLEWYGKAGQKNHPHLGSHVSCKYGHGTLEYSSKVIPKKNKTWYKGWHRFAVEATTGMQRYYLDSKRVRSLSWKKNPYGISTKVWRNHRVPPARVWKAANTADTKYRLIVQGEVFTKANGKKGSVYYAPSDKKRFPAQSMLLDYVRSYRKDAPDPDPNSADG